MRIKISSFLFLFSIWSLVILRSLDCFRAYHINGGNSFRTNNKKSFRKYPVPTKIDMIFDFLRKRSEEGIAQVANIASKTMEGKFSEALTDSANYVKTRQKIDAENLKRLFDGLSRSRDRLLGGISEAFSDESMAMESRLNKLEEVLLQADIGSVTTNTIISDLREYARQEKLQVDDIAPVLRERLIEALTPTTPSSSSFAIANDRKLSVIFVIGANGMGKTTTIGKIAARLRNEGNASVLLGACDTFRAAAVEQLAEWSRRANVSIEMPTSAERGGDPVPVVSRTIERAQREGFDFAIIDTSGRLSNNFELTQQLVDMKEAIKRLDSSAPHETLLVVDGSLGRNAVEQALTWRKYVGITGLAVTKMDGTARGGFVVSVVKELGIPIKFIGVGEKLEDLRDFHPQTFVDALLGNSAEKLADLKARADKIIRKTKSSPSLASATADSSVGKAAKDVDSLATLKASFEKNSADEPASKVSGKSRKKTGKSRK